MDDAYVYEVKCNFVEAKHLGCYNHLGFLKLLYILLHMVNMLGQATWIQLNFNSYLCVRVVINYQKGGD